MIYLWVSLGVLFAGIFVLYIRNEWIFEKRTQLLNEQWEQYDLYLDYKEMLWRFWVWDVERLKK